MISVIAVSYIGILLSLLSPVEKSLALTTTFNEGWYFRKGLAGDSSNTISWEQVKLPHTWNAEDPFDDEPGYYRGRSSYKKSFQIKETTTKKYFLYFEGVNQTARVSLNGKKVGEHLGGYTGFAIDISMEVRIGSNELLVEVSNEHDINIPPLKGDFNFYGGIYRDVYLVSTGLTHFQKLDHGSNGVQCNYSLKENGTASINVLSDVVNGSKTSFKLKVRLQDKEGNVIASQTRKVKNGGMVEASLQLDSFKKWSTGDPYLYTFIVELLNANGVVSDRVSLPVGFRSFRFDPENGFFLNDQPLKLLGVNRHQDFKGLGSALPNSLHVSDLEMIKSLGANFLRTAHYPQDPAVLEACDRLGILVSMEIPIDHDMTDNENFRSVTKEMMREMITQHKHHPSVILWAYMNEMFLGKNLQKDHEYIETVVGFARELDAVAKEEDPFRPTMIANHGDLQVYMESGMTAIPDVVGWNLYHGWYAPDCTDLGKFLDKFHDASDKPVIITEFGAGSDPRIHSYNPQRFDFSVEWQSQYYLCYYPQIEERAYVSGAAVWNMFDFGAEQRADAIPHINKKGLCTFDRKPKDAFYVVQSFLSDKPLLKILSSTWSHRIIAGEAENTSIHVVGNVDAAILTFNGNWVGEQKLVKNSASWEVTLLPGLNKIEVRSTDEKVTDEQTILAETQREDKLAINVGTEFFFDDRKGTLWMPERENESNSWRLVGGEIFRPRDRGFGTDHSINGTDEEPLYQTMRMGVERVEAEVQPGAYKVTLHFSEPQWNAGERIFDIIINGQAIWADVDIAATAGRHFPMALSTEIDVNKNIIVELIPRKGETLLCGIQIEKKW